MSLAITEYTQLTENIRLEAWALYGDAFVGVNELAAQRHLMTPAEFDDMTWDKRISKLIARDEDGRMVGLSTITNDLAAWPLISPPYFRRNWPDHYAREAIWYIGIVGVHPTASGRHVFSALIEAMSPRVFASDGLAVMDFCSFNEDVRQIPRATRVLLKRLHPVPSGVEGRQVDTQSTWVFRFDGQGV